MSVLWAENGKAWERRQKPGVFVSGKELLWFFCKVVLLAIGLIGGCYGLAVVAAAWFGW